MSNTDFDDEYYADFIDEITEIQCNHLEINESNTDKE